MKTYSLGGFKVSRLALGTMHLGGQWDREPMTEETFQAGCALVEKAVDLGVNHLDLADIYTFGKSEQVVGRALAANPCLRERLILEAKCGIILEEPKRYDFSYDHIVGSVEATLKRLGTDRVELLALHRPDPLMQPEEVARAFAHLHSSGKVRCFGVSNHSLGQLELLSRFVDQPLVVNQLELSLAHPHLISAGLTTNHTSSLAEGLLDYCQLKAIRVQAWSPVGGGRVFQGRVGETVEAVARECSCSTGAVALAWLLRHPAGIQPVVGTQSLARLEQFCQALHMELSREQWYRLLEAALGQPVP